MRWPQQVQYRLGGSKVSRFWEQALHTLSSGNSNGECLLAALLSSSMRMCWSISSRLKASTSDVPAFSCAQPPC